MSRSSIETDAAKADSIRKLMLEIERYLAGVALYRELGCEPTWSRELAGA